AKANDLVTVLDHPRLGPVTMMGLPLVMEAEPGRIARPAPEVGAHTDEGWAQLAGRLPQPVLPPATVAPLNGMRAVDLAGFIAGPVVTRHLAMLGAEVV